LQSRSMDAADFPARTSPVRLHEALERNGAALIRGAVAPDVVRAYLDALNEIYALYEARDPRFNRCNPNEVPGVAKGDVTAGILERIAGLSIEKYFASRGLCRFLRLCLPERRPTLQTLMTVSSVPGKAIPGLQLHTDGIIQGTTKAVLVMWSPLHSCGVDAPGLRVVPAGRRAVRDYLRRTFPDRPIPGWCSSTEWASTGAFDEDRLIQAFGPPWVPEMQAGDVMVFTNWTIHGSQFGPELTKPRSAIIQRWMAEDWGRGPGVFDRFPTFFA
jgi:Phytanoyl-CoA dioxygenase (PhyH)